MSEAESALIAFAVGECNHRASVKTSDEVISEDVDALFRTWYYTSIDLGRVSLWMIHTQATPITMPDLHSLPAGSRPTNVVRHNGPDALALERYKLRELAEGWPMYR